MEIDNLPVTKPLVELQGVFFGYRKKQLLSDIHLSVHKGERLAIVGDNGQGKSTLIKVLMGLLKPTSGKWNLNVSKSRISYVTQRPFKNFHMPMQVNEFMKHGLVGSKVEDEDSKIRQTLDRVGLSDRYSDDISILSGGQFQRLVLGRAIIRNPELMFLDEPTTGLDRRSSRDFMNELEHQCKDLNVTTIMVLHSFRHLERDFTRLAWIHNGLVETDTVENWLKKPSFREFIGLEQILDR